MTRTVLSDAARLGNYTYRRTDNSQLQTVNLLTLTGRPADARIQRLVGQTPLPNDFNSVGDRINSAGYRFNSPSGSTERLWGFRIDYTLSDRHRFEGIYSRDSVYTANDAITNNTGEPFPGLPGKGQSPKRHRGSFAWNATLSPAINNEVPSGFCRQQSYFFTNVARTIYLTPGTNGATLAPGFFLRANPEAGNVDYIGNGSFSNYHALQAEVRRRLRNGLYLQANYAWSKGYTDFDGSSSNFSALLDLDNGAPLEKKRQTNDVTHIFKANGLYELPFGPGKRFVNYGGVAGKILGGWQVGSIFEIRTGRPISYVSARGTVNRNGRSAKNSANSTLSPEQLQELTGLFKDPVSGRPLFVDPSLIGPDGRANPAYLTNPVAGKYGTLQLTPVSGPGFWNVDLSAIKRTRITESFNIEFRLEAFNAFNHANFAETNESNDINSTTFGRLNTAFDPRILQIAMRINF